MTAEFPSFMVITTTFTSSTKSTLYTNVKTVSLWIFHRSVDVQSIQHGQQDNDRHWPRETIGGASGGGATLFSTTKPGTDVGITPEHRCTIPSLDYWTASNITADSYHCTTSHTSLSVSTSEI